MGATNHTTYYELSQFIGTDKPAWLQDYNGDMAKIDVGINAAKVAADDAATAASEAQGDATDALTAIGTINGALETIDTTLGTAVGNINTINSLIGNGTPTTSDQTIIGAINGLEGSIAPREDGAALANNYAIGEQFARGGSVYTALVALTADTQFSSLVLNTDYEVSDPITDQIKGIKNTYVLADFRHKIVVTADGIKTRGELYNDLADAVLAYVQSLDAGSIAHIDDATLASGKMEPMSEITLAPDASSLAVSFGKSIFDTAGVLSVYGGNLSTTTAADNVDYTNMFATDGTMTHIVGTGLHPDSGREYVCHVSVYKAI